MSNHKISNKLLTKNDGFYAVLYEQVFNVKTKKDLIDLKN